MSTKSVNSRRGLMLVMSSPSGAGKTTLSRRLLEDDNEIVMSVSATTREPREGEVNGEDYYFVPHERFRDMIEHDELLEHALVFENRYGTPRGPVMQTLNEGKDVLFDIDWQGTQQLAECEPDNLVSVFILPPSISELESRLRKRALDPEDVVQKRMAEAVNEISHWAEYDYVLVNDDLDETFARLKVILQAEREKKSRRLGLSEFVRGLNEEKSKI